MAGKKDKKSTLQQNDGKKERKTFTERWQRRKTRRIPYYGMMAEKKNNKTILLWNDGRKERQEDYPTHTCSFETMAYLV